MTFPSDKRDSFRQLHQRDQVFVMPNPWDIGSARLLESLGFEALATTSAGFAWSLGKHDMNVTRDELVAHVAALAAAVEIPLSVDAERCFAETPAGVAETAAMLADAGASGFSIEDWNPAENRIDPIEVAVERLSAAAAMAHQGAHPLVLTGRAENHLHGVTDLDDTIARLVAYRDAGADAVFAPGLSKLDDIRAVVDAVGIPLNVIALPNGPSVVELATVGVRRVSIGGALARAAYSAMIRGARELLEHGTSTYTTANLPASDFADPFRTR
jgi:2-methylisocitrate lyase-like PEP mutase family enzyme